jgi:hypothetical protein
MGILDWLTGNKPAPSGVARESEAKLRKRLLAVNRASAPFKVREATKKEQCDLVAEWRIVDAKWIEIFAKAGIKRVFKVRMRIDAAKGEVRAVDEEWEVEWRAGVPTLSASASASRGRKWEKSYEAVYAFKEEDLSFGKIYEYSFSTSEIKDPLIKAAHAAGWGWRGVAFGKL